VDKNPANQIQTVKVKLKKKNVLVSSKTTLKIIDYVKKKKHAILQLITMERVINSCVKGIMEIHAKEETFVILQT